MKTPPSFFNKEVLTKVLGTQVIKSSVSDANLSQSQLYVSGVTFGNQGTHDQRSFSGWGLFMAEEKPDGNIFEHSQFNNLFNADQTEATIRGAIEGLSRLRNLNRIELIMEDAYLPLIFANPNFAKQEESTLRQLDSSDAAYWRINRRMNFYADFKNAVDKSPFIDSLSIRYSPVGNHSQSPEDRQIFSDDSGFNISGKKAMEGYKKAIRGGIWFLQNNESRMDLGKSIVTFRKNLNHSYHSTKEFLLCMSGEQGRNLPHSISSKIVKREYIPMIEELRKMDPHERPKMIDKLQPFIINILNKSNNYPNDQSHPDNEVKMSKKGFVPDLALF